MAKPAIPYERVAEAAFGLKARGDRITNRSVRAISGGSPATVSEYLKRLEKEHPELFTLHGPLAPDLPPGLLRVLQEELRRREAEVAAALEEQLATARENIDDLLRENRELQEEMTGLEGARDELAAERDRLQGQVQQQAHDLERLQTQFLSERQAAEAARVDLAQARLKADNQQELAASLRDERDNLRKLNDEERTGRVEVERALAGAHGSLQELRRNLDQVSELHQRAEVQRLALQKSLDSERAEFQQTLDAARAERSTSEKQLAACQAQCKAAQERAEDLQRREADLRVELAQARNAAVTKAKQPRREK